MCESGLTLSRPLFFERRGRIASLAVLSSAICNALRSIYRTRVELQSFELFRSFKQKKDPTRGSLFCLARPERFELPTPWFVARYSIQLSYGRIFQSM